MAEISAQIREMKLQLEEKANKVPNIFLWVGCASGENRTMLVLKSADVEIICNSLTELDADAVMRKFIASGHMQRLNEAQGSTAGTGGIRGKSAGSEPVDQRGMSKLERKKIKKAYGNYGYAQLLFHTTADVKSVESLLKKGNNVFPFVV